MPLDLSTDKKIELAIANFKSLLTHPGWIMFDQIVRENIEAVKGTILKGIGEETIDDVKRLRDKLAVHEAIINTPTDMIKSLGEIGPTEVPNDDPFAVVEDKPDKI